ncbi:MAG: tetraacyldisaccharide 4'-kinase [Gammaproteobacteria bacterium]|nr:tetraacyldisaccharide 4'-kinase [Gammaproteobacteria bacterium]
MTWLINSWYKAHPVRWLLWPLSAIYRAIISLRRSLYQIGIFKQYSVNVPVIIVGNISVGGTGKTPFVIWLAKQLQHAGFRPGIISRGYGGKAESYPQTVTVDSEPSIVGDEPLIINRQSACPMVVAPDRVSAATQLLEQFDCNIIIADDGLQHYALARDIEIVIVDSQRLFGNQYCLPAGPLREPLSRLKDVDFIVHNGDETSAEFTMATSQGHAINLMNPELTRALSSFQNQTVHAIAGIGYPERFFKQLSECNLNLLPHSFSDHHPYQAHDLNFDDGLDILMTEKDAVKCQHFANKNMWYVPIDATINGKLEQHLLTKLAGLPSHG